MNHVMRLRKKPFEQIKSGVKTIELRLYDEKRQNVKVGDIISFLNDDSCGEVVTVKVEALHLFNSFKELFEKLPMHKCGFAVTDTYDKMELYYDKEEQKRYSAVGIEFTLAV